MPFTDLPLSSSQLCSEAEIVEHYENAARPFLDRIDSAWLDVVDATLQRFWGEDRTWSDLRKPSLQDAEGWDWGVSPIPNIPASVLLRQQQELGLALKEIIDEIGVVFEDSPSSAEDQEQLPLIGGLRFDVYGTTAAKEVSLGKNKADVALMGINNVLIFMVECLYRQDSFDTFGVRSLSLVVAPQSHTKSIEAKIIEPAEGSAEEFLEKKITTRYMPDRVAAEYYGFMEFAFAQAAGQLVDNFDPAFRGAFGVSGSQ